MRLDKNIWDPACPEYLNDPDHSKLDVSYFTTSSKVFVSIWLELLQDYRAPVTRQLHELSSADLTSELLRALDLWTSIPKTVYRVVNLAQRLNTVLNQLSRSHPAQVEADRYIAVCDLFCEFLGTSKKERDNKDPSAVWPRACAMLDFPAELNGGNPKAEELFTFYVRSVVIAIRAALAGRDAFMNWLRDKVQTVLLDTSASALDTHTKLTPLVRELLSHALRRGFSRENLAELPIKYLRADSDRWKGKSLSDRIGAMLRVFGSPKQRYEAFVPLMGPTVEIDGKIFPDGIRLESWESWRSTIPETVPENERKSFDGCQAFYLDIDRLLEQDFVADAFRPQDIFSARDIALKSVRRCLDVVFLLKQVVPSLGTHLLVKASDVGADDSASPYIRCLERRRDVTPESISLRFLRSVPAEWVDALHWFREGVEDPSDEVGIVNLWTSLELLSLRSKRKFGSDAERVQATLGELASISIFEEECYYFDTLSRKAASGGSIRPWMEWVDETETDIEQAFSSVPHLGGVFASLSSEMIAESRLGEIQAFVRSTLVWAYGCRNDIVHEGRRQLPGADVLRGALAAIVRAALSLTLRLESQGHAGSLEETYFWAEQELETLGTIGASKDLNALIERVRFR